MAMAAMRWQLPPGLLNGSYWANINNFRILKLTPSPLIFDQLFTSCPSTHTATCPNIIRSISFYSFLGTSSTLLTSRTVCLYERHHRLPAQLLNVRKSMQSVSRNSCVVTIHLITGRLIRRASAYEVRSENTNLYPNLSSNSGCHSTIVHF